MDVKRFQLMEWARGLFVVATAVTVWLQVRGFESLSIYDVFPLFGLLAFGLMWTHYVNGAFRRMWKVKKPEKDAYWAVSTGMVLALIILHPLLLNYGLVRDGLGLPPASYTAAYPGKAVFLLLGTLSLLVFLAFELRRWYKNASWWKYVDYAQLAGMVAIFVHALVLGRELSVTWYLVLWWLYGISFIAAVVYSRWHDSKFKEVNNG